MRWDFILFFAGAALTAAAVKYANEPWLWDGTLYLGLVGMAASVLHGGLKAANKVGLWKRFRLRSTWFGFGTRSPTSAKYWKHTLEDLYASDFSDLMNIESRMDANVADPPRGLELTAVPLRFRLYQDFRSNTDFVSIYLAFPSDVRVQDQMFSLIKGLRDDIPKIRDGLKRTVGTGMQSPGTDYQDAKDLRFSGRVYVYTNASFTTIQLGELARWYRSTDMALDIRGNNYWLPRKDR